MRAELPLELFALNCCVPETLSKIVLGSVSSAVSTVTDDRDNEFPIFFVVSENSFESIRETEELFSLPNSAFKDLRLYLGSLGTIVLINTESTVSLIEEALFRCASCKNI